MGAQPVTVLAPYASVGTGMLAPFQQVRSLMLVAPGRRTARAGVDCPGRPDVGGHANARSGRHVDRRHPLARLSWRRPGTRLYGADRR